MKLLTTALLLIAAYSTLFAQITYTTTDMPAVPSTWYNGVDTLPTGFTLGQNGANRTWNFATVARHLTDTIRHRLPSTTAYASTFSTATDAVTPDNTNFGFFRNSAAKFECLGLAGDLLNNGTSLDVVFNPIMDVYRFPVAYSNNYSSTYGFVKQVSGSSVGQPLVNQVRVTFTSTFYDTIDAWGTLTTPIGTYQTIRQKRVEYSYTKIDVLPFFPATWNNVENIYDTTITYNWLAKETKGAVLTANVNRATGAITRIAYSLTPPAVPPVANFTWVNTYGGFVQFTNTSTGSPTSYAWTFGDGGTSTATNPSHTYASNGTYNVCLTATNASGSHQYCTMVTVTGKFTTTITGPAQRCSNQRTGVAYSATSRPGNTYSWTATGGSIATGGGTAAVTVNWNASGPYNLRLIECNSTGQYCDTANLAVTILPAPTTTITQTICFGQSFEGYSATGVYTNTYTAANGCDSTRTLNLTVRPNNTTTVNISICPGGSYQGYTAGGTYTDVYTGANGCDSTRTLNLTVRPANVTTVNISICPGSSYAGYTISGNYTDSFTDVNGCDSTRTLNLTVQASIVDTLNLSICNGNSYFGYTSTGTYLDTFTVGQCDSVRVLNLSVLTEIFDTVAASICPGGSYLGYTAAGSYNDTYTSSGGCDSTRTLLLTLLQPVASTVNQTICFGDNYQGYTADGTYTDTYTAANGCDSTRTLNLTVRPQNVTSISESICFGTNYAGYTVAGVYTDVFTDANGCDSTRTVNLTIQPEISTTITQTICAGQSFEGYTTGGTYTDGFAAADGCDSTRTLVLTVTPAATGAVEATICDGQSYFVGGANQTLAGTYYDTIALGSGCDSIVVTTLTLNPTPAVPTIQPSGTTLSIDSTDITDIVWFFDVDNIPGATNASHTATENGTYYVVVTNSFGCASVSDTVVVTGVGIANVDSDWGLTYYPNPTSGKLTIELSGMVDAGYSLYNSLGQMLLNGTALPAQPTIVDLGSNAEGVYYLKVQVGNELVTKKVLLVK